MRTCLCFSIAVFVAVANGCGSDDSGDGAGSTQTGGAESTETQDHTPSTGDGSHQTDTGEMTVGDDPTGDASTSGTDSGGEVDPDSSGAIETSDEPVEFTMTSPAFEEGGLFPGTMHILGGNISPQLDWVGAPEGTASFGVFFHDLDIAFPHSAIWDISSDATGLPEGVEASAMPSDVPGAVQCENWNNSFGYGGPGSESNVYQFTLYALDVATLEEVDSTSSLVAVRAALEDHAIATAVLTGQSAGPG